MNDDWQPAALPEIQSRVSAETRSFEPVDHAQWAQISVPPFKAKLQRSAEYGEESVFVVARDGQAVIFFDDAEDGFAGATLDAKGSLKACRLYGELVHALRRFRRGGAV